ncbi:NUDIX hydrolase [Rhodococcoides corynebacterioides]|uniref:NUDIX hydrolase n=1 Tax=Rhodococcoides corynebacterioides TaxID=53972 RepID=A0ABS7P8I5_9NOCA|nr:NUDIX hydrolase [Rhodococcus corynebacterioides]MBY6367476.1 NUDIX hydrolase [Rhodococcus corynebacterioides]MBY6407168.1 NUDIX hydrolase [Rhodococcus corynebacterioides]
MRGDGDGWVFGSDGSRRWGRHGAAGLLLRAPGPTGRATVLLQHRAGWSHHGGTWALPGGAIDSHESPEGAAVREAGEEAGIARDSLTVRAERVTWTEDSGWSYTTVIADADTQLATVPNGESTELRWVAEEDVESLPLHPSFARSWPALRSVPVRAVLGPDVVTTPEPRTVDLGERGFGWIVAVVATERVEDTIDAVRGENDGTAGTADRRTTVVITADDAVRRAVGSVLAAEL